ncbi:hypothetical protein Ais01nite_73910 [Asanoa ishikariensis]|uniref:Diguanylate cyclase (GGDEF) domain-containing protein n=1 Tax=Asanoa ishikariensis TaxID=137265 RepID=A0A1H3URP1_9ACTN|nr:GGDEF domain-containing protein [Asanoa ishikariensis]GIF69356.1 hypothetical protein Ais01nite_73910 [Asanoa ishikariensis]SDZ65062.1 diguanylate cyclase (GGDEF) domain-containing protein [Asanoa ishikariensis]
MRLAFGSAMRWISVVTTMLLQSASVHLLLSGRAEVACVVAIAGIAVQAILLALFNDRAARAEHRIVVLEADLAIAYTDPVTGLPVRRVAEEHLRGSAGADVTVALVDVDGMHDVNTAHTHDGGDLFLAALAQRLVQAAAPGDLVARLGGDEFVLVTRRAPPAVAFALASALAPPVTIGGIAVPMRVSIGICHVPGGDPHLALGCADRAMYAAKRCGRGIEHYDPVRDGEPLSPGVRPGVRHRDRGAASSIGQHPVGMEAGPRPPTAISADDAGWSLEEPRTDAQRALRSLSKAERLRLLDAVFNVLEFGDLDGEGMPGPSWSADTFQDLSAAFAGVGVVFTPAA